MFTSVGLNVKAGISILAIFIAPSISFGSWGTSAEIPSTTLNSPFSVKKTRAILFK